jgi:hypothetical protein
VVTVVKSDDEILTSDNPVSLRAEKVGQNTAHFDPSNILSLPIDKHHLLQLRSVGDEIDMTMLGRMPASLTSCISTEINNQYQYVQCDKFLLGTENGLKNFQPNISDEDFKKKMRAKWAFSKKFG